MYLNVRVLFFICAVLLCGSANAQRFAVGLRGGLPISKRSVTYHTNGRMGADGRFFLSPYTIGPALEVRLWRGLNVETGALFKHVHTDEYNPNISAFYTYRNGRADIWEFPLLLKVRRSLAGRPVFSSVGSTLRRAGHERVDGLWVSTFKGSPSKRETYTADDRLSVRYGLTAAGGTSWRTRYLRFEPELRYTHWTSNHWLATTNQIEILLGISALIH